MQDSWRIEKDERLILIEVKSAIEKNLAPMRSLIKQMNSNSKKTGSRHELTETAEHKGTQVTKIRQEEGHKGTSDQTEALPPDKKIQSIQEILEQSGIENESAKDIARNIVVSGTKYEFVAQHLNNTSEFFTVRPNGGTLLIGLNVDHPAYDHLISLLDDAPPDEGIDNLRKLGLLKIFLPEIEMGYGIKQNQHHIFTVYQHNLLSLKNCTEVISLFLSLNKPSFFFLLNSSLIKLLSINQPI
jgi:hypothetical protein